MLTASGTLCRRRLQSDCYRNTGGQVFELQPSNPLTILKLGVFACHCIMRCTTSGGQVLDMYHGASGHYRIGLAAISTQSDWRAAAGLNSNARLVLAEEVQNRAVKKLRLLPVGGVAGLGDDIRFGALDPRREKLQYRWGRVEVGIAGHE